MTFNPIFEEYLAEAAGENNARVALDALSGPASVSVRLNPSKADKPWDNAAGQIAGTPTSHVEWSPCGFFLPERPVFTLDPLMHAGCYYVQDSSAMFVGNVFRHVLEQVLALHDGTRPLRILDLCAAPGGKTTDIAASLRMSGCPSWILVSNEIMKQRATVLADNAGVWGDPSVVVTSADPKAFASMPGWFDIIVADVPCSGEGMFRKDEEAVAQWSADNVALCQARQRRILADVWPALAPDGVMIYSTCTFNKFENDVNVEWAASELGAEVMTPAIDSQGVLKTNCGFSLIPGLVPGEGQYCAALKKTGGSDYGSGKSQVRARNVKEPVLPKNIASGIRDWFNEPVTLALKGDMIIAVPEALELEIKQLDHLHPLLRGTAAGQLKGKDIVPDADLALSIIFARGVFPEAELTKEQALAFLHKDTLTLTGAEKGFVLVTYCGHPLGFVKNLGNRCNNLHPQNRRIRMNI